MVLETPRRSQRLARLAKTSEAHQDTAGSESSKLDRILYSSEHDFLVNEPPPTIVSHNKYVFNTPVETPKPADRSLLPGVSFGFPFNLSTPGLLKWKGTPKPRPRRTSRPGLFKGSFEDCVESGFVLVFKWIVRTLLFLVSGFGKAGLAILVIIGIGILLNLQWPSLVIQESETEYQDVNYLIQQAQNSSRDAGHFVSETKEAILVLSKHVNDLVGIQKEFQAFKSKAEQALNHQLALLGELQHELKTIDPTKLADQADFAYGTEQELNRIVSQLVRKVDIELQQQRDLVRAETRNLSVAVGTELDMIRKERAQLYNYLETFGLEDLDAESRSSLKQRIHRALDLYGDYLPYKDYALASEGSRPMPKWSSPSYEPKLSWADTIRNYFGATTHLLVQPHENALNDDNRPGKCWSFSGSRGHLTVRLAKDLVPTHVSLDHVNPLLVHDRSPACRQFEVLCSGDTDDESIQFESMGIFEYDKNGPTVQTFGLNKENNNTCRYIRLQIYSNWGNTQYTCLYRLRIHRLE